LTSPSKLVEKLRRRAIQNFMDILVLTEMKKGSLSGYDVIGLIHQKFGILLSSGTVYSLLYSLERNGLIKGVWNQRKRVYILTEKGEQNTKVITNANEEIQNFLRNMLLLKD
jgi:DNA-binding PadR family transcriptional regulator